MGFRGFLGGWAFVAGGGGGGFCGFLGLLGGFLVGFLRALKASGACFWVPFGAFGASGSLCRLSDPLELEPFVFASVTQNTSEPTPKPPKT